MAGRPALRSLSGKVWAWHCSILACRTDDALTCLERSPTRKRPLEQCAAATHTAGLVWRCLRAFRRRSTSFEMTYRAFAGSATTEELSRQRDCSDIVPMITQCHLVSFTHTYPGKCQQRTDCYSPGRMPRQRHPAADVESLGEVG